MTETADPTLISEVRKYGVFNARGCFACGSCTIACDLATASDSFPRRTMQSVVLGLSDSVSQNLDPWLCHDCGDCTTTCPRQADPQQSMMTLRRYLLARYDWTGLSSRISHSTSRHIAALFTVAGLMLALIILYHLFVERLDFSVFRSTGMGMQHMFPRITYFTLIVFLLPLLLVLTNAWRMFRITMSGWSVPGRIYLGEAKTLLGNMFTHLGILNCAEKAHRKRWVRHWLLAFSVVLMGVIKVFFLKWFQTDNIYRFYHPQRWLGYIAAACLIFGTLSIVAERIRKRGRSHIELTLPVLLLFTALSGIAVHAFRYAGFELAAHYTYAIHLMIAVPMLLVEVAFGTWSHMIYRPMALYLTAVKARASAERQLKEAA